MINEPTRKTLLDPKRELHLKPRTIVELERIYHKACGRYWLLDLFYYRANYLIRFAGYISNKKYGRYKVCDGFRFKSGEIGIICAATETKRKGSVYQVEHYIALDDESLSDVPECHNAVKAAWDFNEIFHTVNFRIDNIAPIFENAIRAKYANQLKIAKLLLTVNKRDYLFNSDSGFESVELAIASE